MATFFGLTNLNGHQFAAVHLEVSSIDTSLADPIEIVTIPLDKFFNVHGQLPIFNMQMKPLCADFEHSRINQKELARLLLTGYDADKVADFYLQWFYSLELPKGKKIVPICWNWTVQREVMIRWLGFEVYHTIFSETESRDLRSIVYFLNDRAAIRQKDAILRDPRFSQVCKKFNIERIDDFGGSPMSDCNAYGQIYRVAMRQLETF